MIPGSRTISFYKKPFDHPTFSAESIFKNLARILYLTKETNMLIHYNISKTLFDKAAYMMKLQYADIATYTIGETELGVFKDLDAGRNCCNGKFNQSWPIINLNQLSSWISGHDNALQIEKLINHPVHIDKMGTVPSSLIPFCSFGGEMDLFGEKISKFQVPVCNLFREKIVRGQVCYEANLSQYKDNFTNWEEALQIGLTLIVDTNDEYDVRNLLIENNNNSSNGIIKSLTAYKKTEDDDSFVIHLKTISR